MGDDLDARSYRALLALGALGGLWLTRHGLTADVPAGADVMGHVARADAGLHLLGQGRLDGWFTTFGSGYRLFGVYGQGFTVLVGVVKALSLGTLSTAQAVAVVGSLSIAAVPPTLASLSRSLGSTRRVAALHGALGLSVSFGFGGGIAGVYSQGLLPHAVAIPLLLITASALIRSTRTPRPRPLVLAALGVAALVLVHPISVIVLVTLLPGLLLGARGPGRSALRSWARPAVALGWGAALAAFWALPAFVHRDLRGGLSGWADVPLGDRVREIARGEAVLPQAIAVAAGIALAVLAGRAISSRPERRLLVAPAWATGVLVVGFVADAAGWPPHEAWAQIPNRSLAAVAYLLLLPLAALAAEAMDRIPSPQRIPAAAGTVAVAAFLLPALLSGPLDPPQVAPPPSADLAAAAATVRAESDPSTRHLFVPPSLLLPLGTSEPTRWLAVEAGRPTAHLYFPEATASPGAGLLPATAIEATSPEASLGPLRRAGLAIVVLAAPLPAGALAGQLGYRRLAQHGMLEVWAVEPDGDGPDPASLLQPADDAITGADPGLRVELRTADAEHLRWRASTELTGPVVAAVAYDPAWKVTVDGEAVRTTRSSEGLVHFELPAGEHEVEARFTDDGNDPLGIAVSAFALVALAAFAARGRLSARPTRRTGSRASSSPSGAPSA